MVNDRIRQALQVLWGYNIVTVLLGLYYMG
jgi:hypothetical protein